MAGITLDPHIARSSFETLRLIMATGRVPVFHEERIQLSIQSHCREMIHL